MNLNELAKRCHEQAKKSWFFKSDDMLTEILTRDNMAEYTLSMRICQSILLVISELIEAMKADRNNNYCNIKSNDNEENYIFDENLPEDMFISMYEEYIKNTFEDKIADALIRIFDLCGYLDIDIDCHLRAAMRYNALREGKHGKNIKITRKGSQTVPGGNLKCQ